MNVNRSIFPPKQVKYLSNFTVFLFSLELKAGLGGSYGVGALKMLFRFKNSHRHMRVKHSSRCRKRVEGFLQAK